MSWVCICHTRALNCCVPKLYFPCGGCSNTNKRSGWWRRRHTVQALASTYNRWRRVSTLFGSRNMQRGNIGAEIFAQDDPRPAQRIVPGVSFCWWHAIVLPTEVRNRSSSSDRMGLAYGVWSCCCMCGRLAPGQLMHRNWCGIFAHTASMESRVGWSLFKCGRYALWRHFAALSLRRFAEGFAVYHANASGVAWWACSAESMPKSQRTLTVCGHRFVLLEGGGVWVCED